MTKPSLLIVAASLIGCSGSKGATGEMPDLAPPSTAIVGQHGQVVDYFSLMPLSGFTVTDGTNTTTTDADGKWVLPAPMDVDLAPTVTGPSYSMLQLAMAKAVSTDVDLGFITIPSTDTFTTELNILGADTTKALVQVIIIPTGSCTSVAGGTLTVTSPANAAVAYFSTAALPLATQFYDTKQHRPSAVVYNIDPGATLEVTMNHPTCKLSAAGTPYAGAVYEGVAKMAPSQPGANNAAIVLLAE
jgi:hypothetical protein